MSEKVASHTSDLHFTPNRPSGSDSISSDGRADGAKQTRNGGARGGSNGEKKGTNGRFRMGNNRKRPEKNEGRKVTKRVMPATFVSLFDGFLESIVYFCIPMKHTYDIEGIRNDFPILSQKVYNRPLVYLDNGATTQKPRCVVEAMSDMYYTVNANVHRGVHYLSQQSTDHHEAAREAVRGFIHAAKAEEIVFTRGTTESMNLLASSFAEGMMQAGDEVIISTMEHHSNIVPWQIMAARKGIGIRVIPIHDDGTLDMDAYRTMFTEKTRLVSVMHVSNVLGTINPVDDIIGIAHAHDVPVMIDGAQSTPHFPVNVQKMDCDFFAFSGHKMYGPTGIGVLYGKEEWLDRLPPYQGGGEMIESVTFEKTTFGKLPFKFEAGTPDYVATHGLAKAIGYLNGIGMENVFAHESELTRYAIERMKTIDKLEVFGPEDHHDAVVSFKVGDIHHLDLGTLLDRLGIAIRTGHHCAEPLMHRLGVQGTARASFGLYNTFAEVDALVEGIRRVSTMF